MSSTINKTIDNVRAVGQGEIRRGGNSLILNTLVASFTSVSASSNAAATLTVTDFFVGTELGEIIVYAFSPAYGTAKIAKCPYAKRSANTMYTLGTAYGLASIETGNSGTGGDHISFSIVSTDDLQITVDFTDGSGAVSDGEVYVYKSVY